MPKFGSEASQTETCVAELVPLKEDMWADTAKTQTPLASLSLHTGQTEPLGTGQSESVAGMVSLGFDLNCPEQNAYGAITGIKRAFLAFDCGKGRTADVRQRTGYPAGETFNNAKFTPHSVDANKPSWCVASADGGVIGLVGDVPQSFVQVFNLPLGACVRVQMTAYVKDIEATFVVPSEGQSQSVAKTKIKKRLRELGVPGGESGEAVLASDEIKFCAREA